ncbi:ubiquitin carboxyl-terminal hydrolase family protein, putative [Ichthyophthirius multifiliis]|uniref:Ubiquitin carboxyl-terminal hydrolase n=1 Tax=Ichthyophthirius multifiliis TaxID=5932 RepID=G0QXZ0_ICHMU|nr:ubiquitin carboxyl-terminal hydrolase family protein, putative [Ichthyophthirius multifiliis]EGR29915.1 ubiquitin carboxyl-terminal hydrolase family protein, putative [Ichthyophthirius multifiliis]|eukprot:XP_004031151.1 ubiquitin carboxyl-terminal hydrolase family protein, putative [Ichthyophthirius multifiliis]
MTNSSPGFDYKLKAPLICLEKSDDATFQDVDITENEILVVEIQKDDNSGTFTDFFFKMEGELNQEQCDYCRTYRILKFQCKCQKASYCTESCRQKDISYHSRVCDLADQDTEEEDNDNPYQFQQLSVRGICGLNNLGNTCFMNSALQCMSNTEYLTYYFLKKYFKNEINLTNPLGTNGKLVKQYSQFIKNLWISTENVFQPLGIKRAIASLQNMFAGYQQHDSQEFLSFILDGLHEDLNRIKQKAFTEQIDSNGEYDNIVSKKSWINHLKRNQSIIVDIMQGQFKSKVKCPECGKKSVTFDPFLTCTLPIPHQQLKNIDLYYIFVNNRAVSCAETFYYQSDKNLKVDDLKSYYSRKFKVEKERLLLFMNQYNGLNQIQDSLLIHEVKKQSKNFKYQLILFELDQAKQNDDDILLFVELSVQKSHNFQYQKKYYKESYYPRPFIFNKNATSKDIHLRIFECLKQVIIRSKDMLDEDILQDLQNINQLYLKHIIHYEKSQKFYQLNIVSNNTQGYNEKCNWCHQENCENCQLQINDERNLEQLMQLNKDSLRKFKLECLFFAQSQINHQELKALENPSPEILNQEVLSEQNQQQSEKTTIYDCFNLFQLKEQLGEDNEWYCSNCKKHQRATKKMKIYRSPQILIIHLKRFKNNAGIMWKGGKLTKIIDFPLENLDITDYVIEKEPPSYYYQNNGKLLYNLYGVVNHFGGIGGGHYTAYCLNEDNWYCFDDSSVNKVNKKDICTEASYILFYKKK